jgi:predicted nucleotidyltransferase
MKNKIHKKFMRIIDSLIKKKIKEEPIEAIILGGSVARGDETEHSDIDIVFYVKRKDIPSNPRRFYKFKGKYIEEHYFPIEELRMENILPEEKILYDKNKKIKKSSFNERLAKKRFNEQIQEAGKYQKLAETSFKKNKLEESFNYLYGLGSPGFIIMHSLPPRFNLPFPSFRLLGSLKKIDRKNKTKTYNLIEKLYTFNNKNNKLILREFKKAYLLMNKIKKNENPNSPNLGFFDKSKVKYNIEGLKITFKEYPFIYSYRFIVGCLSMWTFDKNINLANRKILKYYLLKVLGLDKINKNLVKDKLNISKELVKEAKKLK